MSLESRVRLLLHGKALRALNEMEDPREVLDVAVERQQETLHAVRRGVLDLATVRRQLERERWRRRSTRRPKRGSIAWAR